jgi:hypothetical protein
LPVGLLNAVGEQLLLVFVLGLGLGDLALREGDLGLELVDFRLDARSTPCGICDLGFERLGLRFDLLDLAVELLDFSSELFRGGLGSSGLVSRSVGRLLVLEQVSGGRREGGRERTREEYHYEEESESCAATMHEFVSSGGLLQSGCIASGRRSTA